MKDLTPPAAIAVTGVSNVKRGLTAVKAEIRSESFPVFVIVSVVSLTEPTTTSPKDTAAWSIVIVTSGAPVPERGMIVGEVGALLATVRLADTGPRAVGEKRTESSNEPPGKSIFEAMATVNFALFVVMLEIESVSFPKFVNFIARDLPTPNFTFPKSKEDLSACNAGAAVPDPVTEIVSGLELELLVTTMCAMAEFLEVG